jgi:hypothetical protein
MYHRVFLRAKRDLWHLRLSGLCNWFCFDSLFLPVDSDPARDFLDSAKDYSQAALITAIDGSITSPSVKKETGESEYNMQLDFESVAVEACRYKVERFDNSSPCNPSLQALHQRCWS